MSSASSYSSAAATSSVRKRSLPTMVSTTTSRFGNIQQVNNASLRKPYIKINHKYMHNLQDANLPKYTILKFLNRNQNAEALMLVNHGKDKALSLRLFFKFNRWIAARNKYAEALMNEEDFMKAVNHYLVDIFATKEDGRSLKDTLSILYASDLEYMVDYDHLLGVSDSSDISDETFYAQWQPRALDALIEEMVETVGGVQHCKVLSGKD